ncbi:hypothetical protein Syun_008895 [Stephania yunnanensis]|uniref:Uncharacterized protein n=1 Tax=Stephania yunnanensis TaxID=152371 RepID=A0AAP0KDF7_9MAGN
MGLTGETLITAEQEKPLNLRATGQVLIRFGHRNKRIYLYLYREKHIWVWVLVI